MPSFFASFKSFFSWNVENSPESPRASEERDSDEEEVKTSKNRRSFRRKKQKRAKNKNKDQNSHSRQQNNTYLARSHSVSATRRHKARNDQHQFQDPPRQAEPTSDSRQAVLTAREQQQENETPYKNKQKRKFTSLPSRSTSKNVQDLRSYETQFRIEYENVLPHIDTCTEEFRELSCFHGTLSREAAEAELRQWKTPGSYLLRVSPRKHQRLVLSVDAGDTLYHFTVERSSDGQFQLESSSRRFPNVESLLDYYSRKQIARGCTLSTAVPKNVPSDTENMEISADLLQIKHKIGSGKFGHVLLGYIEQTGNVALKSFTEPTYSGHEMESLWKEIEIMKSLRHPNIIRMLGISTNSATVTLILEYAELGDLHSHIIRCNKQGKELNSRNLVEIARQVACGMAYLEEERIVHRDLAARNVLLTAKLDAKIGDFGLAIALQERESEVAILEYERRPLRWMPLESIVEGRYSSRSDVWAYGVLLWEMFSPGQAPYAGIEDDEIEAHLSTGNRLRFPVNCPEEMSHLMFKCWKSDPLHRPSFASIRSSFRRSS